MDADPDNTAGLGEKAMCRNIKTLYNFDPPATEEEIRGASLQFVRKISGFSKPSKANEEAFTLAVEEVAMAARNLLGSLVTRAEPRDRQVEAERARARGNKFQQRFPSPLDREVELGRDREGGGEHRQFRSVNRNS